MCALPIFQPDDVLGLFVAERIEHAFPCAGGVDAAFDAEPLQQLRESAPAAADPDRTDHRRLLGLNLVPAAGQPIAAGTSEERSGGQESVSTSRSRWSQCNKKKQKK